MLITLGKMTNRTISRGNDPAIPSRSGPIILAWMPLRSLSRCWFRVFKVPLSGASEGATERLPKGVAIKGGDSWNWNAKGDRGTAGNRTGNSLSDTRREEDQARDRAESTEGCVIGLLKVAGVN